MCCKEEQIKGYRLYDLQKTHPSSNYRCKENLPLCRVEAGTEIAGFIFPSSASAARSQSVGVNAIKTVVVFVVTVVLKWCFHCTEHMSAGLIENVPQTAWIHADCIVSTWFLDRHVHTLPRSTTHSDALWPSADGQMTDWSRPQRSDFCATDLPCLAVAGHCVCFCVFCCRRSHQDSRSEQTVVWSDCRHQRFQCVCVCPGSWPLLFFFLCRNGSRVCGRWFITSRPTTCVRWPAWRNSECSLTASGRDHITNN